MKVSTCVKRAVLVKCLLILFTTSIAFGSSIDSTIVRNVDVTKETRPFPKLVSHFNTSLQKAPAPVLGELARKEFGKPAIIRCWLNLDEMWDYRTRKYNYNFKIGVDKYKDIKEKHRETWNWQVESEVHFYDYLSAFSSNADEIMLTIRRYERDILDGKLPVTMADWKTIFKAGLKHYKEKFPNIRYVEVGNEYALKSFMHATADEYYQFYKLGYEAVNEVNEELGLSDKEKILVGGPITTGNDFFKKVDTFVRNFKNDDNPKKTLDFISWHEYTKPVIGTAYREYEGRAVLRKYGLDENMPMFVSEHNPFHYDKDSDERHFSNAATLVKTLYYTSLYSPNVKIFPWVLYHNEKIQTRFMWFKGPNLNRTKADELKMLPIGISMKLLSKHAGHEINVKNNVEEDDIVLVSSDEKTVRVHVVNFAGNRSVAITLENVDKKIGSAYTVRKYILDGTNNNLLANSAFGGRLVSAETRALRLNGDDHSVVLKHDDLEKYGTVFWEISWQ